MNQRTSYRITISGLLALIFAVAAGVWWMSVARPGLVFYLGAALVGLMVWFDFRRGREKREPEIQANEIQANEDPTTLPGYHDSVTKDLSAGVRDNSA